ncbi:LolA-related protein [Neoroseomonas rubea]|uniref:LolA-related protein n=1 Tax=Neoroseomonas rubea TaxID=2748666 RepID=UPI0018DF96A0|nr:LolA-related protein [Roseomonas rubea]
MPLPDETGAAPRLPRRLLLLGLAAQAPDPLAAILAPLAAVRESRATFVEEKELPELERPLLSRGLLAWRAPDRLEKHTIEPVEERFLLEGEVLTIERRGERRQVALDAAPEIRPLVEAVRATLAGDAATLRAHHRVAASGGPARWRIELAPLSSRVRAAVQRIVLEGEAGAILLVETQGRDGRSSMRISPVR